MSGSAMWSRGEGRPLRRPARRIGVRARRTDPGVHCPECNIDLSRGRMNRSCGTCMRLHADYVRLRDWLYVNGAHDLTGLAGGCGVPIETISRLVKLGYLRGETGRREDGAPPAADACEVCRTPTQGTTLCDPCRSRFVDDWQTWLDARYGPAHGAPTAPAGPVEDPDHFEVRPIRIVVIPGDEGGARAA